MKHIRTKHLFFTLFVMVILVGFVPHNVSAQGVSGTTTNSTTGDVSGADISKSSIDSVRREGEIDFVPLDNRGIEGFTDKATASSLSELLNTVYQVMISVASVLAVVMIFYAGFSYAVSSNSTAKSQAKNRIVSALGGLALALSSWLILSTIDEDLINNDIFFTEFVNKDIELELINQAGRDDAEERYHSTITVPPASGGSTPSSLSPSGTPIGVSGGVVTYPSNAKFDVVTNPQDSIDYSDHVGNGAIPLIEVRGREGESLSRDFKVSDFLVYRNGYSNPRYARIDPRLVQKLQAVKDKTGRSITINSGYRHKAYNSVAGGATSSGHIAGWAVDMKISGMNTLQVAEVMLKEFGCNVGAGLGGNFFHIDLRGTLARWTYPASPLSKSDWSNQSSIYCKQG